MDDKIEALKEKLDQMRLQTAVSPHTLDGCLADPNWVSPRSRGEPVGARLGLSYQQARPVLYAVIQPAPRSSMTLIYRTYPTNNASAARVAEDRFLSDRRMSVELTWSQTAGSARIDG